MSRSFLLWVALCKASCGPCVGHLRMAFFVRLFLVFVWGFCVEPKGSSALGDLIHGDMALS